LTPAFPPLVEQPDPLRISGYLRRPFAENQHLGW